jgi:hypothetical protein
MSVEGAEAYFYAWRLIGGILGIDQDTAPKTLEEARQFLDLSMVRHMGPSEEGAHLTRQLIHLYERLDHLTDIFELSSLRDSVWAARRFQKGWFRNRCRQSSRWPPCVRPGPVTGTAESRVVCNRARPAALREPGSALLGGGPACPQNVPVALRTGAMISSASHRTACGGQRFRRLSTMCVTPAAMSSVMIFRSVAGRVVVGDDVLHGAGDRPRITADGGAVLVLSPRAAPTHRLRPFGWRTRRILGPVRADSIDADAEVVCRQLTRGCPWTILELGYGGFVARTYLSDAPEGLAGCLVTGGLPAPAADVAEIYSRLYSRVAAKNAACYRRYWQDVERVGRMAEHLAAQDVWLPDGDRLTVARSRHLGKKLGTSGGFERVHWLLEDAWNGAELSEPFRYLAMSATAAVGPLFALQEYIYGRPVATRAETASSILVTMRTPGRRPD